MAQFSPELIEQTVSVFERQAGRRITQEDTRQAIENISGFFRVLQEWAETEDNKGCGGELFPSPSRLEGVEL